MKEVTCYPCGNSDCCVFHRTQEEARDCFPIGESYIAYECPVCRELHISEEDAECCCNLERHKESVSRAKQRLDEGKACSRLAYQVAMRRLAKCKKRIAESQSSDNS